MKAKVNAIESGSCYADEQRRIQIAFDGAGSIRGMVVIPEASLGIVGLCVDDELEIIVMKRRNDIYIDTPLTQVIRHEQEANEALEDIEHEKCVPDGQL